MILGYDMSLRVRKPTIWVSDQVDTNQPVQSQKITRSLKFRMKEEEGWYYPCSENKCADQLRGYREAALRLCFRICRLLVVLCSGSYNMFFVAIQNKKKNLSVRQLSLRSNSFACDKHKSYELQLLYQICFKFIYPKKYWIAL